jgi:hypothetical protein
MDVNQLTQPKEHPEGRVSSGHFAPGEQASGCWSSAWLEKSLLVPL